MNQNSKRQLRRRNVLLYGATALCFILFQARLFSLQIQDGATYRAQSEQGLSLTRPVKAPRGMITDRNGTPLVTNRKGYFVVLEKKGTSAQDWHQSVLNLFALLQNHAAVKERKDSIPLSFAKPFQFEGKQADTFKDKNGLDVDASPEAVLQALVQRYHLEQVKTEEEQRLLAGVCLGMEQEGFSYTTPYVLLEDVDAAAVTAVKEHASFFPEISVEEQWVRSYCYPQTASHVLGNVGKISSQEYDRLKQAGYTKQDFVGKQGAERAFEQYLRGVDGTNGVPVNVGGEDVYFTPSSAAIPGDTVMLTLDLELQLATEAALSKGVSEARSKKSSTKGGAAVVVGVHTGEILAAASYPTYDLTQFHKQYNQLAADKGKPMFHRAFSGGYEPGSTFKPVTAIAAIDSGKLGVDETIKTRGIYHYLDRTFQCNLYRTKKQTHGNINVSEALGVSCNYFFYEAGRRVGIEAIAETASRFGLGSQSGVELSFEETAGRLATPSARKNAGGTWYPGDVLQAAIGQSDNLFSPLQLANYAATLANGGTNYRTTLLKAVKSAADETILKESVPEVRQITGASSAALAAVKEGMLQVTQKGGTASGVFSDFPISVAGKTGSAQVKGGTNGMFICYAPAENPQIAVSVVLENGDSGTKAAAVAKEILQGYFNRPQQDNQGLYEGAAPYTLLP